MHYLSKILTILFISVAIFSCKNGNKETSEGTSAETTTETTKEIIQEKIEAQTPEVKKQVNSVMTKSMVTPELKTFSSALVTAGITDILSNQDGPFTLLAPSNEAFEKLDQQKLNDLLLPESKGNLITLLKGHIVKGNIDSAALVQNIKNGTGDFRLETLSGARLRASLNGTDIIIKDANGNEALVGKSDIKGSNGVVHVVGSVLNMH